MSVASSAFDEAARRCAVHPDIAGQARQGILAGQVILLGVNGKLASGKDTLAPAAMARLGIADPVHEYYARALKDEVDELIAECVQHPSDPAGALRRKTGAPQAGCEATARMLAEAISAADGQASARERTPAMRSVLQYWGSDVRRAMDPDYWVRRTLRSVLEHAAAGRSVFITDARFPNEVEWARAVGFTMVRLEVSDEVQAARHLARDGSLPDPIAMLHPSETSLDGYAGFDLVVDNNGAAEQAIAQIAQFVQQQRQAVAA